MLPHKHLIITADIENTYFTENEISKWISDLVKTIEMKILFGPVSIYSTKKENQGITSFCIIETSHIALHLWDEEFPGKLQLDVYSCSNFCKEDIFNSLSFFKPKSVKYKFLDRETNLVDIDNGSY